MARKFNTHPKKRTVHWLSSADKPNTMSAALTRARAKLKGTHHRYLKANSPEVLERAQPVSARAKKHHRARVMSILKRDHFKEVLKDAGKRGKGPRLKGIE